MFNTKAMNTVKYILNEVKDKIKKEEISEIRVKQKNDKFTVELYNLVSDEYDERCEVIELPKRDYDFIETQFLSILPENDKMITCTFIIEEVN